MEDQVSETASEDTATVSEMDTAMPDSGSPGETASVRAGGWVPIDVLDRLDDVDLTADISIIIEGIPDGARLSKGRNNSDRTWSLTPLQLADLAFQPPETAEEQYVLTIRVLSIDTDGYGVATTVELFDIIVRPSEVGPARAIATDPAEKNKAIRKIADRQKKSRAELARQSEEEMARIAEAEANQRLELERRLAEAEERWRSQEGRTSVRFRSQAPGGGG